MLWVDHKSQTIIHPISLALYTENCSVSSLYFIYVYLHNAVAGDGERDKEKERKRERERERERWRKREIGGECSVHILPST